MKSVRQKETPDFAKIMETVIGTVIPVQKGIHYFIKGAYAMGQDNRIGCGHDKPIPHKNQFLWSREKYFFRLQKNIPERFIWIVIDYHRLELKANATFNIVLT
jgi:hypothetical protein